MVGRDEERERERELGLTGEEEEKKKPSAGISGDLYRPSRRRCPYVQSTAEGSGCIAMG